MTVEQQTIFLFSALGAINGTLLSGYFLIIKPQRRLSDYFLGGLLLMVSIRILKSAFLFFNPALFELFIRIGLSACILIGPFLYLYVVSMTRKNHHLRQTWWWYLLPFLLLIAWLFYQFPSNGPRNSWGPLVNYFYKIWLISILAATYHLRDVFKKLFSKEKSLSDEEKWLLNIFIGVVIIYIAYETSIYTSYIVGALSFSFIIYIFVLLLVFQRFRKSIANDPPIKYANSTLSESDVNHYMRRLNKLISEEKPYLNPQLTLAELGKQLAINPKLLSQAINQTTNDNYSNYIAQLRVEQAKRLLLSESHQHYKIATIAFESGFNSLSSFNEAFKKMTGITPHQFRINNSASEE